MSEVVWSSRSIYMFETNWKAFITKHNLAGNKWLTGNMFNSMRIVIYESLSTCMVILDWNEKHAMEREHARFLQLVHHPEEFFDPAGEAIR
ncbi:hypothetical protein PIB30_043398 [Stylosanthes scabra]|uniref:Uncharacterized protein n=1 Tax=Stylosanthes scabra TaxID=79078 RepID=A0ABU6RG82_9FABA|nr:hypothetical protein [Stylosanthes scabra]